jgi:hypothetical protein
MRSIVSPLNDAPDWPGIERRKEPRRPASGEVLLTISDPKPVMVRGQLRDLSESGFQVLHSFTSLRSGQEVLYSYSGGQGRARVMWTRVVPGSVSTGFLFLGPS